MQDLTKRERVFMAIATLWLFMNIVVYFISLRTGVTPAQKQEIIDLKAIFFPFGIRYDHKLVGDSYYSGNYSLLDVYDFSELLVYGISPFVLFYIYRTFLKKK